MDSGGIDTCWTESDLYGPSTVKQILGGNHVKRAQTAHLITLQALFRLYQEGFIEDYPNSLPNLTECITQLNDACANNETEAVKEARGRLVETIESEDVLKKMDAYDREKEKKRISSRFKRHLRRLGVPPQQMKKLTHRGTIIPSNEFIIFFELHVRQIQFKIGIRTREDLDKYLTENVGYYFRVEKVAFVLNEIHMRTPHDYPCYSNNTQQVAFASGRT